MSGEPLSLSANSVHQLISQYPNKPKSTLLLQVVNISTVPSASKINCKLKLSDGTSWVHAMLLEAVTSKSTRQQKLEKYDIVELNNAFIMQKVNNKWLLIFQKMPRIRVQADEIVGDGQIGKVKEYSERLKQGWFDMSQQEQAQNEGVENIDVRIKIRGVQALSDGEKQELNEAFQEIGQAILGSDQKMNQKDKRLLENPEQEFKKNNPFKLDDSGYKPFQEKDEKTKFEEEPIEEASSYDGNVSAFKTNSQNRTSLDEYKLPIVPTFTPLPNQNFVPIQALVCNTKDWKIKARVSKKYDKRFWDNSRGKGCLMNFELIDSFGGSISCTLFKEAVDKLDQYLKEGSVYTFSGGQVKLANLKYTSIKNDYTIVFDCNSEIIMVQDDESIQTQSFNFKTVKDLINMSPRTVDLIGIIHQCGPVKDKTLKNGTTKMIRHVIVCDDTDHMVQIAIWSENAKLFELSAEEHPVVAMKRVGVCDYLGKTLNSNNESLFVFDPAHPRTQILKDYYQSMKDSSQLVQISSVVGAGETFQTPQNLSFVSDILALQQTPSLVGNLAQMQPLYCSIFIANIKQDSCFYLACPDDTCRRKVQEESVGWRCESCNRSYETCNPTYVVTARIADVSGEVQCNFYQSQGEVILGMTARRLRDMRDVDGDVQMVNDMFQERLYQPHGVLLKLREQKNKNESGPENNAQGQDQPAQSTTELHATCCKVLDHSYSQENDLLINVLNAYKQMSGWIDKPYPELRKPKVKPNIGLL